MCTNDKISVTLTCCVVSCRVVSLVWIGPSLDLNKSHKHSHKIRSPCTKHTSSGKPKQAMDKVNYVKNLSVHECKVRVLTFTWKTETTNLWSKLWGRFVGWVWIYRQKQNPRNAHACAVKWESSDNGRHEWKVVGVLSRPHGVQRTLQQQGS